MPLVAVFRIQYWKGVLYPFSHSFPSIPAGLMHCMPGHPLYGMRRLCITGFEIWLYAGLGFAARGYTPGIWRCLGYRERDEPSKSAASAWPVNQSGDCYPSDPLCQHNWRQRGNQRHNGGWIGPPQHCFFFSSVGWILALRSSFPKS
jgi:hypothetical protein